MASKQHQYPARRNEPIALSRTASAASSLSQASSGGSFMDRASPIPFDDRGDNIPSDSDNDKTGVVSGQTAWQNYAKQFNASADEVGPVGREDGGVNTTRGSSVHEVTINNSTTRQRERGGGDGGRHPKEHHHLPPRGGRPRDEVDLTVSEGDGDHHYPSYEAAPRGDELRRRGHQQGHANDAATPPEEGEEQDGGIGGGGGSQGGGGSNWVFDSVYYEDNYAHFDVPYDRQYEEAYRRQLQTQARRREEEHLRETLEMEECTFHPNVNPERGRKKATQQVFERLANSRSTFHRRQEQIKMEQEEVSLQECFFTPEINRNYENKLQEWIGDSSATERLYGHALHQHHQRQERETKHREEESAMLQDRERSAARARSAGGSAAAPRVALNYLEEQRLRTERATELKQKLTREENVTFKPSINKRPPTIKNDGAMHKIEVTLTDADRLRRERNYERLARMREAEHGTPQVMFQQAHRDFNDMILQGSARQDVKKMERSSFLSRQDHDIQQRWERVSTGEPTPRSQSAQPSNTSSATQHTDPFAKRDASIERRAEKKRKPLHLPLKCQDKNFLDTAYKMNINQQRVELRTTLQENRERFESMKKRNVYKETAPKKRSSSMQPTTTATSAATPRDNNDEDEQDAAVSTPRQRSPLRVPTHQNSPTSKSVVRAKKKKLLQQQGVEFTSPVPGQAAAGHHHDPSSGTEDDLTASAKKKVFKRIPYVNADGKESMVTAQKPFHQIQVHAKRSSEHREKVAKQIVQARVQEKKDKEEKEMEGATFNPETNKTIDTGAYNIREIPKKVAVSGENFFLKRMELAKQRKLEAEAKLKVKPAAVKRKPYVNVHGQRSMVTDVEPFQLLEQHLVESDMYRQRVEAEIEQEQLEAYQFQPTTNSNRYYYGSGGTNNSRMDDLGDEESFSAVQYASGEGFIPSADDTGVHLSHHTADDEEAAAASAQHYQHQSHLHDDRSRSANDSGINHVGHHHSHHHADTPPPPPPTGEPPGGSEWRYDHEAYPLHHDEQPSPARARHFAPPANSPSPARATSSSYSNRHTISGESGSRSYGSASASAAAANSTSRGNSNNSHQRHGSDPNGSRYQPLVSPLIESPPSPRRRMRHSPDQGEPTTDNNDAHLYEQGVPAPETQYRPPSPHAHDDDDESNMQAAVATHPEDPLANDDDVQPRATSSAGNSAHPATSDVSPVAAAATTTAASSDFASPDCFQQGDFVVIHEAETPAVQAQAATPSGASPPQHQQHGGSAVANSLFQDVTPPQRAAAAVPAPFLHEEDLINHQQHQEERQHHHHNDDEEEGEHHRDHDTHSGSDRDEPEQEDVDETPDSTSHLNSSANHVVVQYE